MGKLVSSTLDVKDGYLFTSSHEGMMYSLNE